MTVILRRVARPLLATIFVTGGINALRHAEGHAKAAEPFLNNAFEKFGGETQQVGEGGIRASSRSRSRAIR